MYAPFVVTHRDLVLTLLVLALGTACGNRGGDAEVDPTAAIEGFDASSQAGSRPRSRLNTAVIAEPQASREAALQHLDSAEADVRIAAVYALSLTIKPEDADALAPLLESRDVRERVLAASAMLAIGDGRAVPVLVGTLGLEDALPFGAPPLRVWEQARIALLSFTGQDFGLGEAATAAEAAATAPEWEAWWADTADSFEVVRRPTRFER